MTKIFAYFLRTIFLVIFLLIFSHLHCDFVSSAIINLQLNPMGIITINEITISRLRQAYETMISIRVLLIIQSGHSTFSIIKHHLFIRFTFKLYISPLHYLTKSMVKLLHQQYYFPNLQQIYLPNITLISINQFYHSPKGNSRILFQYNNYRMNNYFQYPSNPQGSLKIYQPPRHQLHNHLYGIESNTAVQINPQSKSYLKKETIIDQLEENKEEAAYRTNGKSNHTQEYYYGKTPSIQDLVDMIGKGSNKFLPPLPEKIQKQEYPSPMKANKFKKQAQQINESPKDNFAKLLKLGKNSESHIVLPSFPSKEHLNESYDKSLSRPFLRKKTTSQQGQQSKRQDSYEMSKLNNQIKTLKEYNENLTSVIRNIKTLKSNDLTNDIIQTLRGIGLKPLSLFKLMVQKAIIAKEECD